MLQAREGKSVRRRGEAEESNATLYVPLTVRAENADGDPATSLPTLEYRDCSDPAAHWTLQPEGESAGRCSFFVRGELSAACSLREARDRHDFVYVVAGFSMRDYGSRAMRHWEVFSRVSSRYYHYGN